MKSMTGFGRVQESLGNHELEINIRSVNGRFLDLKLHLSREYLEWDPAIRAILKENCQRGSVDFYMSLKSSSSGVVELDLENLKQLKATVAQLKKHLGKEVIDGLGTTFWNSGLLTKSHSEDSNFAELWESVKGSMLRALISWNQSRESEGNKLTLVIRRDLEGLKAEVEQIRELRRQHQDQLSEKMKQKLLDRLAGLNVPEERLLVEIHFWLEKGDFEEELDRLDLHIQNMSRLLESPDPQGKKLDFYTQELHREINTLGSKSLVADISKHVVECKTRIERIREQIQNLE